MESETRRTCSGDCCFDCEGVAASTAPEWRSISASPSKPTTHDSIRVPNYSTGSCTIERAVTTPGTDRPRISNAKATAQVAVAAARDDLIEISREIHANPELAMEEKQASSLLVGRLEARGFAVERGAV